MKLPISRSLLIAVAAVGITLVQAQEPKCHAPTAECERQIRQMLSGRRYLGIQVVEGKLGLVIKAVLPDSPASRADLKPGDRLVAINGRWIGKATASDFKGMLADARPTGTLWLIVQRSGAFRKVETRLEPYPKEYVEKVIAVHLAQSHTATAGAQP